MTLAICWLELSVVPTSRIITTLFKAVNLHKLCRLGGSWDDIQPLPSLPSLGEENPACALQGNTLQPLRTVRGFSRIVTKYR
jgi:hypothetical protein